MTDLDQMHLFAARADEADAFLDTLGQVPDQDRPAFAAARNLAQKLRLAARREVTVGFVGVFTTGKSLLISLLGGVPDMLPVSNQPTTGNVTRIRIRPAAYGSGPGAGHTTVSLLSPAAVAELADYVVDAIVGLVTRERLPYDVRPLAGWHPVDPADPSRPDLSRMTEFLRPLWADPALNLQIRLWAAELFQIGDALLAGGHLLPATMPDTPRSIKSLGDAVTIGDSRQPPREVPVLRPRAPILATDLYQPQNLQTIRPLIQEVAVDLQLPEDVWSFGGVPVDLLDFPGLASGSLRDRFLAERELGGTSVVAFVVDAEKPKNDDMDRLYGILEKGRQIRAELAESILAVVNRFDRVKLPGSTPATVADLAGWEDYRDISSVASELTRGRPERMALISSLAVALRAGYHPPGARDQDLSAEDTLAQWDAAVAALRRADPADPVAAALDGYRRDGGLTYLRDLISRHVSEHGLRIWLAEAAELDRQLDGKLDELKPRARQAFGEDEQRRIEDLVGTLGRVRYGIAEGLDEIRLLTGLSVGDVTVTELLRDKAAQLVHVWQEWLVTAAPGRPRSTVPPPPGLRIVPRPDEPERPAGQALILRSTADLRDRYDAARHALMSASDQALADALTEWTHRIQRKFAVPSLAPAPQPGASPRTDGDLLRAMLTKVTTTSMAEWRIAMINSLADPALLASMVPMAAGLVDGQADGRYPFADNRALPWHEAIQRQLARLHKQELADPLQVSRLRRDVVRGLHYQMRQRAQAILDLILARVSGHLGEIESDVIPSPTEMLEMTAGQPGGDGEPR